jgi:hypothetical protein
MYIAAKRLCTQLFWMKKVLEDYSLSQDTMTICCDNSTTISLKFLCNIKKTNT